MKPIVEYGYFASYRSNIYLLQWLTPQKAISYQLNGSLYLLFTLQLRQQAFVIQVIVKEKIAKSLL